MSIDLHVHSSASDGTVPPERIPELASRAGLRAVALTDHDTVAGLAGFLARQPEFPDTRLIGGVELSTRYGGREIHLVGLFVNPQDPELAAFMDAMRAERELRAAELLARLSELGYPLTAEELNQAGAAHAAPGRPHFARALAAKYGFADNAAVFAALLKRGAPGYVPRRLPEPEAAISAIKHAGGAAVWAHPIADRGGEAGFARRLITRLKPAGLDAVEAYYTDFIPAQTAIMLKLAAEHHLAVSGGSDFHGANHPAVSIGVGRGGLAVPDELLGPLEQTRAPKVVILPSETSRGE